MTTRPAPDPGLDPAYPLSGAFRRLVVPVVAAVVTLVVGVLQLIVMSAWASHRDATLREVMMQWDSTWMSMISEHGYSGFVMTVGQTDPVEWESVAFFPGYPVLVRMVAAPWAVLDSEDATFLGALMLSALCAVLMAWGASRLALDMWSSRKSGLFRTEGDGQTQGRRQISDAAAAGLTAVVTVLVIGAPMGIVYWMPYSESLFGALTVWALVFLVRRRYLLAGVLTLGAGLTRLTAVALILVLCVAAAVELWKWWRTRSTAGGRSADSPPVVPYKFPLTAVASPIIGSVGAVSYLAWANSAVSEIGGYFAAQERGWDSGFDFGAATFRWLGRNLVGVESGDEPGLATGYMISSWTMVLVALLCVVSVWPLVRRWIPWQVWLVAILTAGIVLSSDGIMHSRPRLLLMTVFLLLLPFVVGLFQRGFPQGTSPGASVQPSSASPARNPSVPVWVLPTLLVVACVLWCVLGFWVSGSLLIDFPYAI